MLEILFVTGGFLRMTAMHMPPGQRRLLWLLGITLAGALTQFALFPFLGSASREGIMMMGMVVLGLWILASGLLSMKSAPTWHSLRLLGFFGLVVTLLFQNIAPLPWILTSVLGIALALLSFFLRPLWLRAITYGWALLHAVVLELLYLLPLMELTEPPLLDVLLMGSLFVTLGTSGLFTLKYCCMLVATLLRGEKEYTDLLHSWLGSHFPARSAWKKDLLLFGFAGVLLVGGFIGGIPMQTALFGTLALLMFPN